MQGHKMGNMVFGKFYSRAVITFFLLWMCSGEPVQAAEDVDNEIYGRLLSRFVSGGVVDYRGFKAEEGKLDQYLEQLERTNTSELTANARLAFYINAYNAWTIRLVLGGYPGIKSIRDLGAVFSSPWAKKICRIDGKILSLDDIEHGIIRPGFRDPRIHFAVNCASRGCPPLASEPYSGVSLDEQLDTAARNFINDPARYRIDGNMLFVSMIFKWYASDFTDGVLNFIIKYARGDLLRALTDKGDNIKIRYLKYDWSLNGK